MTITENLDEEATPQGDSDWRGFRSRPQPTTLPAGIARFAQNMRMERTTAQVRKGIQPVATDLSLQNSPTLIGFALPVGQAVFSVVRTGSTVRVSLVAAVAPAGWGLGDTIAVDGADQTDYNDDWRINAVGTSGGHWYFEFAIATTPVTPATTASTIVAYKGARIFELPDDRLRAAVVYTDDAGAPHVLIATGAKAYAYNPGAATVAIDYPSGELVATDAPCALEVYLNNVYLFRGRTAGPVLSITSITRVGSVVTVTTTTPHGLISGDWAQLIGQQDDAYRGIYQVTYSSATVFTYDIGAPTPVSPASVAGSCYKVRPVLRWDRNQANDFVVVTTGTKPSTGHIRMPAADWGLAFNRQLILPYARNEIILTGFGVDDDLDTQLAELRIKPGGNDWLVGVHPLALTRFMVLYRKSLHRVGRDASTLAIASVDQVPGSVGCVARQSICTCGDYVAWLSDTGVQLAQYVDQLNVLTARMPLSADVQDVIDRINWAYADRAVAAYHDNRYFLALPLDGATVNSAVLVFNFLNAATDSPLGEWESLDVYPAEIDIAAMVVTDYNGRQELHYVTTLGGLYVAHQGAVDTYGAPGGATTDYPIPGSVQGRRFLFGTLQPKRFVGAEVSAELAEGDQIQVAVSTVNPDSTRSVKDFTATAASAGDRVLSSHLRSRGESAAVDITMPAGRAILRAVTITAKSPGKTNRDRS